MTEPARLTVLSGPSGVGKGSVIAAVRRRHPQVWLSVSATTRAPRPGETEGVEYHFVDDAEFARMVDAGELLEHASYAGSSYGTPRVPVEEQLARGVPALLEIELQGARLVRAAMPDARLVFLAPPSFRSSPAGSPSGALRTPSGYAGGWTWPGSSSPPRTSSTT